MPVTFSLQCDDGDATSLTITCRYAPRDADDVLQTERILSEDLGLPLPLVWQIIEDAGGTRFVWTTDVLPDDLAPTIAGLMDAGLAAIRSTLERRLDEGVRAHARAAVPSEQAATDTTDLAPICRAHTS